MNLSQMNCSRGAPMGRRQLHTHGVEGISFELEWVPLIDGDYDCGGAYWGSGTPLYHAVGTLDGEEVVSCFLRSDDRESVIEDLLADYPGCTVQPENGSLIKQTITFLRNYAATEDLHESHDDSVEEDISVLEQLLEEKGIQ